MFPTNGLLVWVGNIANNSKIVNLKKSHPSGEVSGEDDGTTQLGHQQHLRQLLSITLLYSTVLYYCTLLLYCLHHSMLHLHIRDMVKQEVDVSEQEVRFSTTWSSPTETNGGLGLSMGLSYAEIWANRKWMSQNRKSGFPSLGLVLLSPTVVSVCQSDLPTLRYGQTGSGCFETGSQVFHYLG